MQTEVSSIQASFTQTLVLFFRVSYGPELCEMFHHRRHYHRHRHRHFYFVINVHLTVGLAQG